MRIIKTRITKFRSIQEVEFSLDRKITTLVGSNESGKSNILKALTRMNHDTDFEEDDISRLYDVEQGFPEISMRIGFDRNEKNEQKRVVKEEFINDSKLASNAKIFNKIFSANTFQLTRSYAPNNNGSNYSLFFDKVILDDYLKDQLPRGIDGKDKLRNAIVLSIINFLKPIIYFNDKNISLLQKQTKLDDLKNKPDNYPTINDLLKLGNTTIGQIVGEPFAAEGFLREVEQKINEHFPKWWKQDPNIKFKLNIDHQRNLNIHIEDKTSLREFPESRSDGVQWFMAFLIKFLAETKEGHDKGAILLFDELGLHLHPQGQRDLLRLIEDFSENNQIIYTTHFPYLINQNNPERIFVVKKENISNRNLNKGTNVIQKPHHQRWESVRSSIGLLLGDNLLVAEKTLIVEGPTELFGLRALNNYLRKCNLSYFDSDDVTIFPAGGTGSDVQLAARFCLAENLAVVVLVDGDKDGKNAKTMIAKEEFTKNINVFLINDFTKQKKEATFEDLIPPELYAKAINNFYSKVKDTWNPIDVTLINDAKNDNSTKTINKIKTELEKIESFGIFDKVGVMKELSNILELKESSSIFQKYEKEFKVIEGLIKKINVSFAKL